MGIIDKIPGKSKLDMVKQMSLVGKNQAEQMRIQVEQIILQTTILERWAIAAERQATAFEKFVKLFEEKL